MNTDPERALKTAKITSDRLGKKLIKSAVGYASTLFKGDSDLSFPTETEQQTLAQQAKAKAEEAKAEEQKAQAAEERKRKTDAAVAALTPDETSALIAEFIEEKGAVTFDRERGKFRDVAEQVAYRTFTRKHASSVVASRAAS